MRLPGQALRAFGKSAVPASGMCGATSSLFLERREARQVYQKRNEFLEKLHDAQERVLVIKSVSSKTTKIPQFVTQQRRVLAMPVARLWMHASSVTLQRVVATGSDWRRKRVPSRSC